MPGGEPKEQLEVGQTIQRSDVKGDANSRRGAKFADQGGETAMAFCSSAMRWPAWQQV
jgi:hypothetical protein